MQITLRRGNWNKENSLVYDQINGVERVWLQVYSAVAMGMLWVQIQACRRA